MHPPAGRREGSGPRRQHGGFNKQTTSLSATGFIWNHVCAPDASPVCSLPASTCTLLSLASALRCASGLDCAGAAAVPRACAPPLVSTQIAPHTSRPRPCSLDHFVVLRRRRRSNMLASTSHPIPGNTSRAAPALALRSNHFARLQSLNCADLKPFSADIVRNERHNQGDFFCFVVLLASVQHGALPFPSTSPQPVQSPHFRPAHSGSHWQWQDIVVRNLSLRPRFPLSPSIASYALPLLSVLATAHMPVLVLQPNRLEIVSALSAPSHPWSHCRLLRAGYWWSR